MPRAKKKVPVWVERITENFRVGDCPRCRRTVLRGICDGIDTRLELRALTAAQDVLVRLYGIRTFDVRIGSRIEVAERWTWSYANPRERGPKELVMAQHRCPS